MTVPNTGGHPYTPRPLDHSEAHIENYAGFLKICMAGSEKCIRGKTNSRGTTKELEKQPLGSLWRPGCSEEKVRGGRETIFDDASGKTVKDMYIKKTLVFQRDLQD